jgi:hypothetical protein
MSHSKEEIGKLNRIFASEEKALPRHALRQMVRFSST